MDGNITAEELTAMARDEAFCKLPGAVFQAFLDAISPPPRVENYPNDTIELLCWLGPSLSEVPPPRARNRLSGQAKEAMGGSLGERAGFPERTSKMLRLRLCA